MDIMFTLRQRLAFISNPIRVYFLFKRMRDTFNDLGFMRIFHTRNLTDYGKIASSGVLDHIKQGDSIESVESIKTLINKFHAYVATHGKPHDDDLSLEDVYYILCASYCIGIIEYDFETKRFVKT